jgi:hypothetical protein
MTMYATAVAYNNLADLTAATISALGFVTLAPPSLLKNPHVSKKWRHNASTTYVLVDLGSIQGADTFMLAGLNLFTPFVRLRLSTADPTGVAGNIYDSGSFAPTTANYNLDSGLLIFPGITAGLAGIRYVRFDLVELSLSYIEAGRVFVGTSTQFTEGSQTPWSIAFVRNSVDIVGVGGQTFVDLRPGYRRLGFSFDFITEAERTSFVGGFISSLGVTTISQGHIDALWMKDISASATYRAQDSVWGYIEGDIVLTENLYMVPSLYSASFAVRQRL